MTQMNLLSPLFLKSVKVRKKIICFDFDGVIHSYSSGWKGPRTIPDPPVPGMIGYLFELTQTYGVEVCIHSSRSKHIFARWCMRRWLKKNAGMLWYEGLEKIKFPRNKPPAFITIDDRAIQFEGVKIPINELLNFQPWNRRNAKNSDNPGTPLGRNTSCRNKKIQ